MSTQRPQLIQALLTPGCYDHPVGKLDLVETHISWVILTGDYAYKIKKPVDLGFLDFSRLEQRHYYCKEELRLNRRLAPDWYLAVVPIGGSTQSPNVNGTGAAIEYAVKMRQFPQAAQLDRVLARGELTPSHIDALARRLAVFHDHTDIAAMESPFGSPELVLRPVEDNFIQIEAQVAPSDIRQLERLRGWCAQTFSELEPMFLARKRDGFVRECHGDLHLANMMLADDDVVIFDCLEFNENLRWIDVVSEVAFLTMDLDDRGRPDLARRCLNAYLGSTGDYAGLRLLRFYQVYRALVRAKVACIRLDQGGLDGDEENEIRKLYRSYTTLAERYTHRPVTPLMITQGLSGSGKTTFTQALLEAYGGIRLRSDVERKRLHGLQPGDRSGSDLAGDMYTDAVTDKTYQRLEQLTQIILRAGFPVIVDAAFLKRRQRERLRRLAQQEQVPFIILALHASETLSKERLHRRAQQGHDASEATVAVLEHQLRAQEPLAPDETPYVYAINSDQKDFSNEIKKLVDQLATGG